MLLWTDLETTGLDPNKNLILEMGFILTDDQGNEIESIRALCKPYYFIEVIEGMEPFVREMHTKSGLIDDIFTNGGDFDVAVRQVKEALAEHISPTDGELPPMCGSTVFFDRNFLRGWAPELLDFFHYRHIDVSGIKESLRRWSPATHAIVEEWESAYPKEAAPHRSIPDLELSIAEWQFYRDRLLS